MNINWKLRLKNKVTLISLIGILLTFIYTVLGLFDVVPKISQDKAYELLLMIVQILATIVIVVDPTTEGVTDSERAMNYNSPK